MVEPHVFKLDLKEIKEPDDLWARFFFAWLKNLSEQQNMNAARLAAIEHALNELKEPLKKLLPEHPESLVAAADALEKVQEVAKEQSTRDLDNVEELAVLANMIVAKQKNG